MTAPHGVELPRGIRLPQGFRSYAASIGIKDATADFAVVASDGPASAAAVFSRSRFAGPSVTISRRHIADGSLRAVAVISKNANVATGPDGHADALAVAEGVASAVGCAPTDVLVASTGVIGRRYPMDRVRAHLESMPAPSGDGIDDVAEAIMTTDTHPKTAEATVSTVDGGTARVVGVAKGVGMIEPDMATMLAFVFTDAAVDSEALDATFRRVVDPTFNSLSVDTDTSTSDTAAVLASGVAGAVYAAEFEAALYSVCLDLTRQLAADGEGASTLIVVTVDGGRDHAQAKRVAKSILNSPLVKTAVHGADPNWGRIAMAVGKTDDADDVDPDAVVIRIGGRELYPSSADEAALAALEAYLGHDEVEIHVSLGIGEGVATVYGCDLTDGYVRINADYTT